MPSGKYSLTGSTLRARPLYTQTARAGQTGQVVTERKFSLSLRS